MCGIVREALAAGRAGRRGCGGVERPNCSRASHLMRWRRRLAGPAVRDRIPRADTAIDRGRIGVERVPSIRSEPGPDHRPRRCARTGARMGRPGCSAEHGDVDLRRRGLARPGVGHRDGVTGAVDDATPARRVGLAHGGATSGSPSAGGAHTSDLIRLAPASPLAPSQVERPDLVASDESAYLQLPDLGGAQAREEDQDVSPVDLVLDERRPRARAALLRCAVDMTLPRTFIQLAVGSGGVDGPCGPGERRAEARSRRGCAAPEPVAGGWSRRSRQASASRAGSAA